MVTVKGGGSIIDGVDYYGASSEVAGAGDGADECVGQQVGAEAKALFRTIQRQPGQKEHWDRIGLTSAQSRWRTLVFDAGHGQGVVADDPPPSTQNPGRCASGRPSDLGSAPQPFVEFEDSAVEIDVFVGFGIKQCDGP